MGHVTLYYEARHTVAWGTSHCTMRHVTLYHGAHHTDIADRETFVCRGYATQCRASNIRQTVKY